MERNLTRKATKKRKRNETNGRCFLFKMVEEKNGNYFEEKEKKRHKFRFFAGLFLLRVENDALDEYRERKNPNFYDSSSNMKQFWKDS